MSKKTISQKELSELVREGHDLYNQRRDLLDRAWASMPENRESFDVEFENILEALQAWREVAGPVFGNLPHSEREKIIESAVCKEEADWITITPPLYNQWGGEPILITDE